MRTFEELKRAALERGARTVAVVGAASTTALGALDAAVRSGLARAVLVGDVDRARELVREEGFEALLDARFVDAPDDDAGDRAAALAGAGDVEILLKGTLRTDQLLRAVLDRRTGLRTDRLLSDVLLYEDTLSGETRLVGVTDGGINIAPTFDQMHQIIENAVAVFHALGYERPRVALMSATEAVTDSVPSTVEARAFTELAAAAREDPTSVLARAEIFGPLALDNALLVSAARAKNITSDVAGRADVMVLPNIEAGNILGKAVKYLAGSATAHVVVGARVPVLIPSRVESADDKLLSIALGVVAYDAVRQ
ncbi:MAG: phosphate acyltransferase [Gemmatimonadota bacterium]|jgi:phosphate butyryltransferase